MDAWDRRELDLLVTTSNFVLMTNLGESFGLTLFAILLKLRLRKSSNFVRHRLRLKLEEFAEKLHVATLLNFLQLNTIFCSREPKANRKPVNITCLQLFVYLQSN